MNLESKIFCILLAVMSSSLCAAQELQGIEPKTIQETPAYCYDIGIILDPEIPLENKQKELKGLQASAEAGNSQAQYVIGSFYRLGEKHPAKIFVKDKENAKTYLSNSAIGGNYAAMAGMAELELSNKNYKDAIFWAQIFAHYSEIESLKHNSPGNQAYQAYLLQRVMQLSKKDRELYTEAMLLEDLTRFHSSYNDKILGSQSTAVKKAEALKHKACTDKSRNEERSDLLMLSGPSMDAGQLIMQKMPSPGYAYYLLIIDPKGKVNRTLVVDSMPDASYAKALAYVAKKISFNTAKGTSMRTAYIPLSFDDHSVAIKKDGAAKK